MEKNMGSASGNPQPSTLSPSAPSAPSAPPSYEEAVENAARSPALPNIPPYPITPTAMPLPAHNPPQMPIQMPMPHPPNYPGASEPRMHSWIRYNPDPAAVPHPEHHRRVYDGVICSLGRIPKKTICPSCYATIKTTTISDHQPSAHLCCIVLCLLGCCLCSCLPYCMSSFTSVHHFCPNCKSYIGTWKG